MLRQAIETGDADSVRHLLESSPSLATTAFDDGSMPLHVAAFENRPEIVEILLAAGAPVDARFGQWSHSPLSWAITCWSDAAAHKLIELGAKPDLFCAAGLGLLDAVKAFWQDGKLQPHPSTTGSSRYTESGEQLQSPPEADQDQVSDALYLACRSNRLEVARWLLDHGADPNWRGYTGATCLAWAEFSNNPALCELLRERGGSDDIRDYQFRATPKAFALMVLAGWGFPQRLLDRLTADPSLVSSSGGRGTLLHAAAESGQQNTAQILLRFGADKTAVDADGHTPADVAAANGHTTLAQLLR